MKILNENDFVEFESALERKIYMVYKQELNKDLIIKLLKMNNSKRKEFFKKITIDLNNFSLPNDKSEYLKNKNIIYLADQINMIYIVTLKGLIVSAYRINEISIDVDNLLDDLNEEYFFNLFDVESKEPLELKEKSIIILLLGLMALTENYPLKISKFNKPNPEVKERFKNSIKKIAKFIVELEGYEEERKYLNTLFQLETEGDEVHTFLRRLDNIQIRTDSIYKKEGNEHYMDILDQNNINEKKLNYILNKVFDKRKLNYNERKNLITLLKEIERERIYLIDNDPDFDFYELKDDLYDKIENYE